MVWRLQDRKLGAVAVELQKFAIAGISIQGTNGPMIALWGQNASFWPIIALLPQLQHAAVTNVAELSIQSKFILSR